MNDGSSFVGFISDKRPALPNGQVGLFYIWHVKQLQIQQGDLVKKNLVPVGKRWFMICFLLMLRLRPSSNQNNFPSYCSKINHVYCN